MILQSQPQGYRVSTILFSDVLEALIQKQPGHRSTEVLRPNEARRVSNKHLQAISNILAGETLYFQKEFRKWETTFEDEDFLFMKVAKSLDEEEWWQVICG